MITTCAGSRDCAAETHARKSHFTHPTLPIASCRALNRRPQVSHQQQRLVPRRLGDGESPIDLSSIVGQSLDASLDVLGRLLEHCTLRWFYKQSLAVRLRCPRHWICGFGLRMSTFGRCCGALQNQPRRYSRNSTLHISLDLLFISRTVPHAHLLDIGVQVERGTRMIRASNPNRLIIGDLIDVPWRNFCIENSIDIDR